MRLGADLAAFMLSADVYPAGFKWQQVEIIVFKMPSEAVAAAAQAGEFHTSGKGIGGYDQLILLNRKGEPGLRERQMALHIHIADRAGWHLSVPVQGSMQDTVPPEIAESIKTGQNGGLARQNGGRAGKGIDHPVFADAEEPDG